MWILGDPYKMRSHEELDEELAKLKVKHGSEYSQDIINLLNIKANNYEAALRFIPNLISAWITIDSETEFARKIGFTDEDLDNIKEANLNTRPHFREKDWERVINNQLGEVEKELNYYRNMAMVATVTKKRLTQTREEDLSLGEAIERGLEERKQND